MSELRCWKKVYESDLESISHEIDDSIDIPAVIILTGDLGAGKTTFVQKFCQHVNHDIEGDDPALSPTYSLINENGEVVHADLYRIEEKEELIHLEIPLYLEERPYFLVEWGKKHERELKKLVPEEFQFYELIIEMNSKSDEEGVTSRNYYLHDIN